MVDVNKLYLLYFSRIQWLAMELISIKKKFHFP